MSTIESYSKSDVIRLRPGVQTLLQKYVLQPLAEKMTLDAANWGKLTPWQVTLLSAGFGSLAALAFLAQMNVFGALLFQAAIVLDLVDGKLARLTGRGSAAGILLDAFSDIYRVLIAASAIMIIEDQAATSVLMLLFVGLHFGEFLVNQDLSRVRLLWESTSVPELKPLEKALLVGSETLKGWGLKLICLHYQERLFLVFFMGALTGNWNRWLCGALFLTLLDYFLKYHFDLALVKQRLNPAMGDSDDA